VRAQVQPSGLLLVSFAGYLSACGAPTREASAPLASLLPLPVADAGAALLLPPMDGGLVQGPNPGDQPLSASGAPEKLTQGLRLPWTSGETWYLTSGPHSNGRAALDFAPPNYNPRTKRRYPDSCSRQRANAHWVRATADGRISSVLRRGCPVVQIVHDDGTTTNYFHLQRKSVRALRLKVGDRVQAGQILGHPSCETGPKICGSTHPASGVHVHFYRTNASTSKRLPAEGLVLSGWTVRAVGRVREGTMTKGSEIRSTRGTAMGRACSPSVGLCAGQRNDLESDNVPATTTPETSSPRAPQARR
jgi:hypothetical protein